MAIRVSEFKSARLSDDGKEVVVDCAGRYTGDLELRFTRDCFDQMLRALIGAAGAGVAKPQPMEPSATEALPPPDAAQPAVSPQPPKPLPAAGNGPQTTADEVKVQIPKNIAVTAGPSGSGLVILIVNHKLENQVGYAVSPDAAGNIAAGLTKSAAAVRAAKASGQPTK
jgi:hypothetical protein